jgi:hypothetical protein
MQTAILRLRAPPALALSLDNDEGLPLLPHHTQTGALFSV